jgi:uncharacterized protein YifE (UPF0438 family)
MAVPSEHLVYLQKRGYTPRRPDALSKDEAVLLDRYGHWLEALAAGWIAPATPEQSRFLLVVRGEAEPQTPFELAWHKLAGSADDDGSLPKLDQLAEVRRYADDIADRKEAERVAVLRAVQAELDAIEQKYAQPLEEANQAVAELEAEVKAEILRAGKSMRAGPVQAVFYRGSVTWDSKALAEYAEVNPEVQQFQKIGAPRVVIKYK